jgi:DNA polymerase-3 subunit epsilon
LDSRQLDNAIDWTLRFAEMAANAGDPRLQAYYRQPPPVADQPVGQTPLLALDLETSGLDDHRDAIISIGFIPFDAHRIRCSGAANWIVRPDRPIPESAVTIHGITHADTQSAPGFDAYFAPLLQAMAGKVIVAHCSDIERRFLTMASIRLTGHPLVFPTIDTMFIEAVRHPLPRSSLFQRWFGKPDRPSLRLDAARTRYGLPAYRPHHALTDALATAELFQAQLQYGFTSQTPLSQLWCRR